nr:MAG TPA: hypothetical protein [Caudoviricetes sp.]DAM71117.1 MAG TPA: hypothetical protein [Caudoviricetes sp.]
MWGWSFFVCIIILKILFKLNMQALQSGNR